MCFPLKTSSLFELELILDKKMDHESGLIPLAFFDDDMDFLSQSFYL